VQLYARGGLSLWEQRAKGTCRQSVVFFSIF
jgi:hypothetical protein